MCRSAFVFIALVVTASARAQTVDAVATTLAQGRGDPRDGNLYSSAPIYQQVALTLSDVRLRYVDDVRLVISGWGELAFMITESQLGATGDLDIGFLEGKLFKRRLTLRLGRQLVYGGAARMQPVDGAALTLRIIHNISFDAYAGVPVTPRFGIRQGDFTTGGRLYWQPTFDTAVGLSFAEMLLDGRQARQDLGVDARWRPLRWLVLTGYGLVSLLELRLAEADFAASFQPRTSILVTADYRRTAPDLFLPRSSILSVFSQETRDEAGATIFWRALSRLRVEGDWHAIVDEAGFGQRGGGRVSASLGPAFETTLALEARFLRLATDDGYTQVRAYVIERLPHALVATLDLDGYVLQKPINGETFSFTSAATLGWDFAPRWRTVISGVADTTPLVQRNFEVLAKLVYNATWRLKTVQK
jgi:hypothetical protein